MRPHNQRVRRHTNLGWGKTLSCQLVDLVLHVVRGVQVLEPLRSLRCGCTEHVRAPAVCEHVERPCRVQRTSGPTQRLSASKEAKSRYDASHQERFQINYILKMGCGLVGHREPRAIESSSCVGGEGSAGNGDQGRKGVLTAGAVRTYGAADREIPFPGACMRPMIAGLPLRRGEQHTRRVR